MRRMISLLVVVALTAVGSLLADAKVCIGCHKNITPGAVSDWKMSKHAENEVGCDVCHGDEHKSKATVDKVHIPTPDTCADCHEEKVAQYRKGKHALGWASMKAMPTTHHNPMVLIDGQKGCGGCHKVGEKSVEEIKRLKADGHKYGTAACDSCHTRHSFSVKEAKQPQACQTCHMGFDHPQWEMYSSSKHGVRYLLKQNGTLPEGAVAPTCQDCHMQDGDHEVRTAWGFLAVRLPLPEDKQWAADQTTILQALGVLDPAGKPTARLDVVKAADVARLTQEDFDRERNKMLKACRQCHSPGFAKEQMAKGDEILREADHLTAEAIRVVTGLYQDGLLEKPAGYANAFPDLLTFHDAPTVIEQKLFVMFLKHRMRAFQGAFHNNPDYALWYGWSELKRDLTEIRELSAELRRINRIQDKEL